MDQWNLLFPGGFWGPTGPPLNRKKILIPLDKIQEYAPEITVSIPLISDKVKKDFNAFLNIPFLGYWVCTS